MFIFAFLPKLQTGRQSDQGNKELEHIDKWKKQTYMYVHIHAHNLTL